MNFDEAKLPEPDDELLLPYRVVEEFPLHEAEDNWLDLLQIIGEEYKKGNEVQMENAVGVEWNKSINICKYTYT